ncbi:MAG: outer membrane protein transport protein [Duncaniella sp.]|nr:outer membrane protein transport protein [Duncaniella sp.]MDE7145417.1 outer membrane protein transport protein [Duncaniella sp.]
MKKSLIAGILATIPSALFAQNAIDAYSVSQTDLRGSARFMSMGGAFTALGGDISTLNQNPAGIGIYRSSDISATLDINMMSSKSTAAGMSNTENWTRVACNNFGYVGSINLGDASAMPFLNWGASYSRVASFDRRYGGSLGTLGSSYTNLVADFTSNDGIYPAEMLPTSNFNPYQQNYISPSGQTYPYAPWSSILMYNSYGINPVSPGANEYSGLYNYNGTTGTGRYMVEEKGYIDEYSINFGGNIQNIVYWGLGFGITDIDYRSNTYYSEHLENANVPDADGESYVEGGTADFRLDNYKRIYGSGFNVKVGVIVKPINELRFGIAVHTPTYYNLTYQGIASTNFAFNSSSYPTGTDIHGSQVTDEGYYDEFDWKLKSPWRLMVGAAGVIGGRAIISADYEYRGTQSMRVQDFDGNEYKDVTGDIKTYYKATNIMRIGAEYRITPAFSIRAGYSYESSPVTQETMDGYTGQGNTQEAIYVHTSGPDDTETQPAFTLDKTTQYITCGIGYRYKNFYADAAYVHRARKSKYQAFTNYNEGVSPNYFVSAPSAEISDNNNSVILTVGFKF